MIGPFQVIKKIIYVKSLQKAARYITDILQKAN